MTQNEIVMTTTREAGRPLPRMFHRDPPDASPPVVEGVSEGPGRILGAVSVVRS